MKPTDYDLSQAEFHKQFPGSIVEVGEWETIKFCSHCEGLLNEDMPCMHGASGCRNKKIASAYFGLSAISCPHCKSPPPIARVDSDGDVRSAGPIAFKLIRRRKMFIEKPGFWKRVFSNKKDKYYYEYSDIYVGATIQSK